MEKPYNNQLYNNDYSQHVYILLMYRLTKSI